MFFLSYLKVLLPCRRSLTLKNDIIYNRIKTGCEMVDVHGSFISSAQRIYDDHVDILIDLGTFGGGKMEIFHLKPAPILVAMCGFATTTGWTSQNSLVGFLLSFHKRVPLFG